MSYRDPQEPSPREPRQPREPAKPFAPAWAEGHDYKALTSTIDGRECLESLQARELLPFDWAPSERRAFAPWNAPLGTKLVLPAPVEKKPTMKVPAAVHANAMLTSAHRALGTNGLLLALGSAALLGGVAAAIAGRKAATKGEAPASEGRRFLMGAAGAVQHIVTGEGGDLFARAVGIPKLPPPEVALAVPESGLAAVTLFALGSAREAIEMLADDFALRMGLKGGRRVLWQVVPRGQLRGEWKGLGGPSEAEGAGALRDRLDWLWSTGPRLRWSAASAQAMATSIAAAADVWDAAAEDPDVRMPSGERFGVNPFTPLHEIQMLGGAVAGFSDQYVRVVVPEWAPPKVEKPPRARRGAARVP